MSLEVRRFEEPGAFVERAADFLYGAEARHTVPISVVGRLRRDPEEARRGSYLATVELDGEVVLAAAREADRNLTLTTTSHAPAIDPLVADADDAVPSLPGVQGPTGLAERFADTWARRTGGNWAINMRTRLFACSAAEPPAGVPGHTRHATPADRAVLIDWLDAFQAEAVPHEPRDREARAEAVDRLLASPEPGVHLWEDGGPVSMAINTNEPDASPRIGGVYTPPPLRRRGYAAACVAAVTTRLIAAGHPQVVLFTDLGNPTSNSVYQRIGYRPLGDYLDVAFSLD